MTIHWYCRTCTACGEGDKAAEQHVRDTAHTVETSTRPRHTEERQSVRYWLTDKGWAAAGGRST
ncbi:hypothetical protein [Nocardioides sp.]|uniref:hypothetical protein n=1 Tax=Nocardioides sp. TaxID=35761 RepID=UPI0035B42DB4